MSITPGQALKGLFAINSIIPVRPVRAPIVSVSPIAGGPRANEVNLPASLDLPQASGAQGEWRAVADGVRARLLVSGPQMTFVQLVLERGAALPAHCHDSAQSAYLISGSVRITRPDERVTVGAGECYLLPPTVYHHVRATEKTTLIEAYSPGLPAEDLALLFAGYSAESTSSQPEAESEVSPLPRPRRRQLRDSEGTTPSDKRATRSSRSSRAA